MASHNNPVTKFIVYLVFLLSFPTVAVVAQQAMPALLVRPHSGEVAAPESKAGDLDSPPLEDFTSLLVPPGLKVPVLPLDKGDFPEYSTEVVRAEWRVGDTLDLWIVKPAGVKNPPVILYLYSYPATNRRYASPEFCKFLTKNGFAAVGFVSALTGERFMGRPLKQWFVSELQESLTTSVHDVQLILNYLSERGDIDMTRLGMFGDGSGASIAIMAAAVDPRIKVLDLVNPWGDWPDWLAKSTLVPEDERAAYLKPEFLKKVDSLDPVKWLPQLKTQQVRLQHIEDLKVTPLSARQRIEAAAPPNVKIIRYENAKAFMANVASTGTGFDWIKQQVGSLPPTITEAVKKPGPSDENTK